MSECKLKQTIFWKIIILGSHYCTYIYHGHACLSEYQDEYLRQFTPGPVTHHAVPRSSQSDPCWGAVYQETISEDAVES